MSKFANYISLLRSFRSILFAPIYRHFVPTGLGAVAMISVLLLPAACQTTRIEPVALAPEDMCSYCRMAISEKQFAAEVLDSEDQAFKFDDIGCLVNFVESKKNKAPIAAYFVMDFDKRDWIKAEEAYYVRTSEVTTPMNGGIIAFRTQSQAQQAVDKYQGKLLGWKDIMR